ncbi:MAG: heme NO-binding domain-containing protein [Cytophagaceae bacterium]|jgi:hypothetical protein|nr:heme NO-binding domain-containing protein [Cytophagaceae bacterium]
MYGIVNKAIEGLVTENFGVEKWIEIKALSNIQEERFLSHEQYDDSVTFGLATAAAEVLHLPIAKVLVAFGKYWVLKTAKKHYGSLMDSGGNDFDNFLLNLPNFHSRVMLLYPNIQPPEFKVHKEEDDVFHVHYYSTRPGLTHFVEGLLLGLGEAFGKNVKVLLVRSREQGFDHDEFEIAC